MTVSTTSNKITYAGDGATTAFTFPFAIPGGLTLSQAAALLTLVVVDSSGVSTTIAYGPASTQWQLSVNSPVSPNPTSVGGTVFYNPSGTPVPASSTLTVARVLPETQSTSLQNQGTLWQTVIEQALDYLTMCVQQIQALFGNAIVAPQTDPAGLNYVLPSSTARANEVLGFDSAGNVTSVTTLPAGTVSSAMQPVVNAATLALGRAAFGLGTMATEGIGAGLQDDGAGNARVIFLDSSEAAPRAITSADYLHKLKITGPITLTFPRANTLWNGFGLWFENLLGGGVLTLAIDSHDTIENGSSGASILIPPGFSGFIMTNASASATWWIEGWFKGQPAVAAPSPGLFKNLAIDVATNTTVTLTADFVSVTDGTLVNTVTPTGGINFAVVGAGGIDTGAIAASTLYYTWAIYNPITRSAVWLVSLQSTANGTFLGNLPAGYTQYARYGALVTTAGSILYGTKQRGRRAQFIVGLAGTTTVPLITSGVHGTYSTATDGTIVYLAVQVRGVGFLVPTTASVVYGVLTNNYLNGANANVALAPSSAYKAPQGASGKVPLAWLASIAATAPFNFELESDSVYYVSDQSGGAALLYGWEDNI